MSESQLQRISAYLSQAEPVAAISSVAGEWLRYYGPRPLEWHAAVTGIDPERWRQLRIDLTDSSTLVTGPLVAHDDRELVCDTDNLEYLLRMMRRAGRVSIEPVTPDRLVAFWSQRTGVGDANCDPDALARVLDTLFGYPATAASWETDILPARIADYHPVWLDGLVRDHGLIWIGCGTGRITLALRDDSALVLDSIGDAVADAAEERLTQHLARVGSCDFFELVEALQLSGSELTKLLWHLVWSGRVSNNSYETVRKGVTSRFTAAPVADQGHSETRWPGSRRPRRSYSEWRATRPVTGRWFAVAQAEPITDPLTATEIAKDRVRLLLDRYGLLFRELLDRESESMRWSPIFRALRLMELSGEVVAGSFVQGVGGPQFALPSVLDELGRAGDSGQTYWISATDPASPCGTPLARHFPGLPNRLPGNHLVFRGRELVMVSRRNGREIDFHVPPEDDGIVPMLAPFRSMVGRRFMPVSSVLVERVNGIPTRESPYRTALVAGGFRADYRAYVLAARYR